MWVLFLRPMHAAGSRENMSRNEPRCCVSASPADSQPLTERLPDFFKVAIPLRLGISCWPKTPHVRTWEGGTDLCVCDQDPIRIGRDDRFVPRSGRALPHTVSACWGLLLLEGNVVRRPLNNRQVRAWRNGLVYAAVRVLLEERSFDGLLLGNGLESARLVCLGEGEGVEMQRRSSIQRTKASRWVDTWWQADGNREDGSVSF